VQSPPFAAEPSVGNSAMSVSYTLQVHNLSVRALQVIC
jgi:hypothetical protein